MNELSPIQVRVLGCLIEKAETTPDQYPLTLNALRTACNQKSSRLPVTNYTEGEVGHAVRELESLHLVREEWGSRVSRYSHEAGKAWNLHSPGLALLATLMLRGPQTIGELRNHAHRLHEFDDLDDVHHALERLQNHEPPMVTPLPRQSGQKEGRYAHLLCGEPDVPEAQAPVAAERPAATGSGLAGRVEALEAAVAALEDRLATLERGSDDSQNG
ncbi:YceH family protein [Elongatibacter sediminis]|uniref:YceH family protein n=1 Tax=Elongatibacter sediminis TaxID=3119006 RepID=A0AAW9RBF2_9GAMM